jgi:hypothetical protein
MAAMKNFTPRIAAALALTVGALLLTGCQAGTPEFDRTLSVTTLPSMSDVEPENAPGPSAGLDLHFGPAAFGLECSTDSVSDNSGGTAAVMCTWTNSPR